jgi:hypothetical protein
VRRPVLVNEQRLHLLERVADEPVGLVAAFLLLLAFFPFIPAPVVGDPFRHPGLHLL